MNKTILYLRYGGGQPDSWFVYGQGQTMTELWAELHYCVTLKTVYHVGGLGE